MGTNALRHEAFGLLCSMTDKQLELVIAAMKVSMRCPDKTLEECMEIARKI